MGLFEKREKKELPAMELPDFPSYEGGFSENEASDIKQAVINKERPPITDLDIPEPTEKKFEHMEMRSEGLNIKKMREEIRIPDFKSSVAPMRFDRPKEKPMFEENQMERIVPTGTEKTLFVKIDQYDYAIDTINKVKSKLEEAKEILRNIERVKEQEDAELKIWQRDLEEIKNKITMVDQSLFG